MYSLHTPPNIVTNIIIIQEREAIHYKTSFNPFFFFLALYIGSFCLLISYTHVYLHNTNYSALKSSQVSCVSQNTAPFLLRTTLWNLQSRKWVWVILTLIRGWSLWSRSQYDEDFFIRNYYFHVSRIHFTRYVSSSFYIILCSNSNK